MCPSPPCPIDGMSQKMPINDISSKYGSVCTRQAKKRKKVSSMGYDFVRAARRVKAAASDEVPSLTSHFILNKKSITHERRYVVVFATDVHQAGHTGMRPKRPSNKVKGRGKHLSPPARHRDMCRFARAGNELTALRRERTKSLP